jgi:hypothetical protein
MSRSLELADLPGIARWLSEGSRSVWDLLGAKGGAELAVAFSSLFWPEFVEVEGCVLLRERYSPSNFEDWWKGLSGDRSRIEAWSTISIFGICSISMKAVCPTRRFRISRGCLHRRGAAHFSSDSQREPLKSACPWTIQKSTARQSPSLQCGRAELRLQSNGRCQREVLARRCQGSRRELSCAVGVGEHQAEAERWSGRRLRRRRSAWGPSAGSPATAQPGAPPPAPGRLPCLAALSFAAGGVQWPGMTRAAKERRAWAAVLGLAAVLLAAAPPAPASASAPSPTYAETRVRGSNLEIPAGVGVERGSSPTRTGAYGLRYDELAVGYPLVPRATTPRINLANPRVTNPVDLLKPSGRLVGEAGTSSRIRILQGGEAEARAFFEQLSRGGRVVEHPTFPGTMVELPGGGLIRYRPVSTSGPPTIDVSIEGVGIREIKFKP